jgi:hypothetical protein
MKSSRISSIEIALFAIISEKANIVDMMIAVRIANNATKWNPSTIRFPKASAMECIFLFTDLRPLSMII